ncbi:hypothetical protein CXB51_022226 [Gossypium anomalum]|uniref:CCHC-type domain-containing protein n=1 Tax=Gossypium anomalum TaxID=47600 RepID=A0A8J5YGX1_9ROSI|nr:hypothetical protein CXB51_022226 [Gossypium anomalum]
MKVLSFSDGDDENELQEARQKGKASGKVKEIVVDETGNESSKEQIQAEGPKEVEGEGLNDRVTKKEREMRLNILIVMIMGAYLGQVMMTIMMLVKEELGSPLTIQTQQVHTFVLGCYLKMVNNSNMQFRIFASYNSMSRCLQVKSFHDEHNGCITFRNKMVNAKVIAEHCEATSRDHPKMKLREIQRRVALEMNVNVNMTMCRRAKKMVKHKLVRNFIEEFAMIWDYANELRLKNPGSTINMAVNRVTLESPPHFKRFYNRRKEKNELEKVRPGQLNRAGLIMRCRKCGGEGHNRRSCNQPNITRSQKPEKDGISRSYQHTRIHCNKEDEEMN